MVAAIGQAIAAGLTAFGLLFVGAQIRDAWKATDLHALQEFLKGVTEREDRFLNAGSDEKKTQAFNEFLNFLEVNAAADNKHLFPKTTRSIVVDKLCSSITEIDEPSFWHDQLQQAKTSSTAFTELDKFKRRHRNTIASMKSSRAGVGKADRSF